jgi:hypothetical protein
MVNMHAAARHAPYVDEDPTRLDVTPPWLDESGLHEIDDVDIEDVTEIRPVPDLVRSCALARPAPQRPQPVAIESLPLPPGLREDMLPRGKRPVGATEVRIAIVRLARELARDYRIAYGCTLRTEPASIEHLQRHLLGHAAEVLSGRIDSRTMAPELVRHGVVLGEILTYALGATWLDLSGDHPQAWQMMVPPGTMICPVARVHRFLLQRNREQDLVGFFLQLAR